MARNPVTMIALAFLTAAAGCREDAPPALRAVETVTVAVAPSSIPSGQTAQATAVVRDSAGAEIDGRSVAWSSSDPGVATVDPAGVVTAIRAGSADITASCDGKMGSVSVSVTAGAPSSISVIAGDGQAGAPGAPLSIAPEVPVTDQAGNPVSGILVTFEVTAGNGTVDWTQATTEADGRASCGTWTLGFEVGVQTLSASTVAAGALVFTAMVTPGDPAIAFVFSKPEDAGLVGDDFEVRVTITSSYPLTFVSASAGANARLLSVTGWGDWSGSVSTEGLPSGPITVVVTATDILGNVGEGSVHVQLDRPPVVIVNAPAQDSFAWPVATAAATCIDDAPTGCESLTISVYPLGPTLASGKDSVAAELDLSPYGDVVGLLFTGTDAAGQQWSTWRRVHVESPQRFALLANVTGTVIDYSEGRVLYRALGELRVLNIGDATTELIDVDGPGGLTPHSFSGFLTPTGAIYFRFLYSIFPPGYPFVPSIDVYGLFEWIDGVVHPMGAFDTGDGPCLTVVGDYALYVQNHVLLRKDLMTGLATGVTGSITCSLPSDVSEDGGVAYVKNGDVFVWRGGVTETRTDDKLNFSPVLSGVNVVYAKGPSPYQIVLHDGTKEIILSSNLLSRPSPPAALTWIGGYLIAGDFVAYVAPDASGVWQVWRHAPSGEEQLTAFEKSAFVESLSPDGTIFLKSGSDRFRSVPGAALEYFGGGNGRIAWRDGAFYKFLDGAVLQVLPP